MGTLIFILIAIILIALTLFFSLRQKKSCPFCNSSNIAKTGIKIYKENPDLAMYGSPSSYNQLEYKCISCGKTFFIEQKSIIFN